MPAPTRPAGEPTGSSWPLGGATAALVALATTATAWLVVTGTAVAPAERSALPAAEPGPRTEVVVVPPMDRWSTATPPHARESYDAVVAELRRGGSAARTAGRSAPPRDAPGVAAPATVAGEEPQTAARQTAAPTDDAGRTPEDTPGAKPDAAPKAAAEGGAASGRESDRDREAGGGRRHNDDAPQRGRGRGHGHRHAHGHGHGHHHDGGARGHDHHRDADDRGKHRRSDTTQHRDKAGKGGRGRS